MQKSVFTNIILVFAATFFLAACKSNTPIKTAYKNQIIDKIQNEVLQKADRFLLEMPITVTDTFCTRSAGSTHDFYSEGDYWWPNPQAPKAPYIHRDGQSNPNNFSAHRHAMVRLSEITATLTSAWLLSNNDSYAKHAINHIEAWFVDSATQMNPNMLYAQAIYGKATGRGIGLIDAYHLVEVTQSINLLIKNGMIQDEKARQIKAWFNSFLNWMTTHPYGIKEMNAQNNHGTCWAATAASFAVLVGNNSIIQMCKNRFKTIFIPNQMAENGSFPLELKRTKPYAYSLFNIDAMCNVAQLLSTPDDNLFEYKTDDGLSLKKGMKFIYPYIQDKTKWPHKKDIYIWDEWPVRQSCLLFAGLAYNNSEYINTYMNLSFGNNHPEVIRNVPVRHPIIWILEQPLSK